MFDTKVIFEEINHDKGRNRSYLNEIYESIQSNKKYLNNLTVKFDIKADMKYGSYGDELHHHDAGFDSYMTGFIFAMISKRLEIQTLLEDVNKEEEEEKKESEPTESAVLGFTNYAEGKRTTTNGKKKGKDDGPKVKVSGGLDDIGLEDLMAAAGGATNMRQTRTTLKANGREPMSALTPGSRSRSLAVSGKVTPINGKKAK